MKLELLKGEYVDTPSQRIGYCNEVNLEPVVRLYELSFPRANEIKAWQVHTAEAKWFRCITGRLLVKIIDIKTKEVFDFTLDSNKFEWLCIPGGHANGIMPLEDNSRLLVGSDMELERALQERESWEVDSIKTNWQ